MELCEFGMEQARLASYECILGQEKICTVQVTRNTL